MAKYFLTVLNFYDYTCKRVKGSKSFPWGDQGRPSWVQVKKAEGRDMGFMESGPKPTIPALATDCLGLGTETELLRKRQGPTLRRTHVTGKHQKGIVGN